MSNVHPQKPKLASGKKPRSKWGRRIFDMWPLAVWFVIVGIMIWSWQRGIAFNQMNGSVGVYQESLSPLTTGRLVEVLVKPGDTVQKGDVLARMDTSLLDKEIEELERELAADREDRVRRFGSAVNDFAEQLRDLKREEAAKQAELAALDAELARLEDLVSKKLILEENVSPLRIEKAELTALVAIFPEQIAEVQQSLDESKATLGKVMEGGEASGESHNAGEELSELDLLNEQKKYMELRAVRGGMVFRVEKEPGEVVREGETVVRVVAEPEEINAFLPQERLSYVKVGDKVWVSPTYDRHTAYPSTVVAISPRITNTPDVSSPLPNKMLHGREVVVALPDMTSFLPGQTVIVHLEEPGSVSLQSLFTPRNVPPVSAVPAPPNK